MRLELPFHSYARKYLDYNTYDTQIIDYLEFFGTPENRDLRPQERIEQLYRTIEEIRRISNFNTNLYNTYPTYYNESRFTLE